MASLYNLVQQAKASIPALLMLGFCWIYLTALTQSNTILHTSSQIDLWINWFCYHQLIANLLFSVVVAWLAASMLCCHLPPFILQFIALLWAFLLSVFEELVALCSSKKITVCFAGWYITVLYCHSLTDISVPLTIGLPVVLIDCQLCLC